LNVASTFWFKSSGTFTVDGGTGTCAYTGTTNTSFTGVTGCSGLPADGAAVRTDIKQTGSGTGINHAGLQLIYQATINVHGASVITATSGNVTMASKTTVNATANANGGPDQGTWTSGNSYKKGDVVTDATDGNRYDAKKDVATDTTAPSQDSTNWEKANTKDAAVTAAQILANAKSQLSDTSAISATGNVSITSNLTTNIQATADASTAGSGAGIAIVVLTTDSEAFIDSSAATPISSQGLTISADTNNTAPTTAKASAAGSQGNDSGNTSNNPSNRLDSTAPGYSGNSAGKGDSKSKTGEGSQPLSAALAVTVDVATTKAYIAPGDQLAVHAINLGSGTAKVHAGAANNTSAIADAGNVKFTPDAPTFADLATAGSVSYTHLTLPTKA